MNSKSLLFAAMAVAALTGCVNENEAPDIGGKVTPGSGEKVKATVTINQAAPTIRAYVDNEVATTEETTISDPNLVIFVFDGETVSQLLEFADIVAIDPAISNATTSQSFTITTGNKYIYVFANVASALNVQSGEAYLKGLVTASTTRARFELEILKELTVDALSADNKFLIGTLWGNDDNVIKVVVEDTDNDGFVDITSTDGSDGRGLEVGRFVSKVVLPEVTGIPPPQSPLAAPSGTYGDLAAYFNAKTTGATGEAGKWTSVKWRLVNIPNRMYLTGRWTGVAPALGRHGVTQVITPLYNEDGLFNESGDYSYGNVAPWVSDTYLYGLENTHKIPLKGNTTAAQFMGTFALNNGVVRSSTDYRVSGTYSTGGTFWTTLVSEPASGTGIYMFFDGDPSIHLTNEGLTFTEPVEYTNGNVYYTAYIKDSKETELSAKYSVLRNHLYNLKIGSINSLGSSSPDIVDPTDPVEDEVTITVTIEVQDWYKVDDQQIDW